VAADQPVAVDTAEAVNITFPTFVHLMARAGAKISLAES